MPKPVSEYDLRLLRVFRTVVQCGGFSAAESTLNVSRSTISVHMLNLEQRMGLKLCNRGRSGFSLTEQGQQVYEAANQLFASMDDFSRAVATVAGEISGELVITCSDEVALSEQVNLPGILALLHEQQPKLQVVLDVNRIPEIEQMLLKEQAHIGIMPTYRTIEGLHYQCLYQQPLYLYCGEKHPLFHLSDADISEQQINRCATVYPGVEVSPAGRAQLQDMNLVARAYHYNSRMALVQSGCYLGFFPEDYVQPWLDKKQIRAIHPQTRFYNVEHSLVTRASSKEQNKIDLFMQAWQAAQQP
ncbi:LysR family transcriptional regulator [Aestuariibacter halophilus]|uniref:LysR family transcriptional regulator n=1 Tax=Fluctibacter halophilus TaxID=226011 RepID=A0ABS8G259_9ALTE|nr:LysR family transcriptional regulator [Aestuariibacter halophilus]MCC2614667.1 LysR family transcriptional regulator [Aestuariibacter halophilus]